VQITSNEMVGGSSGSLKRDEMTCWLVGKKGKERVATAAVATCHMKVVEAVKRSSR
jgi:hypothetical protein